MEPRWYWRGSGQQRGPLSTSELEELVRQGTVQDEDNVRLEDSQDWMSASEIRAIFLGAPQTANPQSTSNSAAQVLADRHRAQMQNQNIRPVVHHGPADGGGSFLANFLQGILWACGNALSTVAGWFSALIPAGSPKISSAQRAGQGKVSSFFEGISTIVEVVLGATLVRYKNAILVVIVIVASGSAAGYFLNETVFADAQNQRAYDQIAAINKEWDRKRGEMSADLRQASVAKLEATKGELELRARRDPLDKTQYWLDAGYRRAMTRAHLAQCCVIMREILESKRWGGENRRMLLGQMSVTDDQLRMNQNVYFAWVNKITLKGVGMTVIAVLAAGGGVFLWRRFAPK